MNSDFYNAIEGIFSNTMPITGDQIKLFEQYYVSLIEKNKVMNLTRITEPFEAAQKHFFDSVSILNYFNFPANASVVDIGTGAGFPGIPLKILRPDIALTVIDSSAKKIEFVKDASLSAGLSLNAVSGRAEELCASTPYREAFELAVSRAVASLPVLLELCTPFLTPGGIFIAYKGAGFEAEINDSKNAISILNLKLKEIFLPYKDRTHALLLFEKQKPALPQYPRKFASIKKRPL